MDFVDAQWRPQRITLPPLRQPALVGPPELAVIPYNGRVVGRRLEEETVRISLHDDSALQVADFELVSRPLAYPRNEDLPHPRHAQRAHLVAMPIPVIEIADHADPLGVGRPDREAGAGHTIDGAQLGPELVINPALVPLPEQEQIRIPQRRQERIRVTRPANAALLIRNDQVVGINAVRFGGHALEEAGLMQPRELERRFVLLVHGLDFDLGGIRHQRPHQYAGAPGQRVHPQQLMGRVLFDFD